MKVLVIRFSSLGDCVLLCPLLAHLKRAGADQVVVLTKRAYAGLFAFAQGVDRVIAIRMDVKGSEFRWRGRDCRPGHR